MHSTPHPSVLLVEDTREWEILIKAYLRDEPLDLRFAENGAAALRCFQQNVPDALLLDMGLPDMSGMEVLKHIQQQQIDTAVIIVTAQALNHLAEEAMRYGALDFLEKPFTRERLLVTLRNALERQRLSRLAQNYQAGLERDEYHGFIGVSAPMQTLYRIIDNVAGSKAPVFITGESGTGKELCALALHRQSRRGDRPFVALNCAAIPNDLLESEIFGHVRGAFTGAINEREGAAARADGGTLFLDEIGDMDLDAQSKLLRFVQTGTFQKVGGNRLEHVDVRFICATNHDIPAAIEHGLFREDLYYRLNVISLTLPPLRKRGDDVLLIARKFLATFAREEGKAFIGFAPETETRLRDYDWPGNVRQLQNVIHNVVVMHRGRHVTPDMLPAPLDELAAAPGAPARPARPLRIVKPVPRQPPDMASAVPVRPLWQAEKELIEEAIAYCQGDIYKAAVLLEINPSTIYRKLKGWKEGKLERARRKA